MRVVIKFTKKEKINYTQNQLQGFVYRLIRNSGYFYIHNQQQNLPRFFNFSQLFQTKDRHLCFIISSPLNEMIKTVANNLKKGEIYRIGNEYLEVLSADLLKPRIKMPLIIKTETPIIIRVPKKKYDYYGFEPKPNYEYFYWRPLKDTLFEPFVNQLEARIYKQYKLFAGKENIKELPIFYKFKYLKTIDLPFYYKGQKISRPGTLWEFELNSNLSRNFIHFIIDIGLGELTSQGYGFVNIK